MSRTVSRFFVIMFILAVMVMVLLACQNTTTLQTDRTPIVKTPSPSLSSLPPVAIEKLSGEYAAAQSTLDAGQRQLDALSQQATMASLNKAQAANAAAQATRDYIQIKMMELSYQATLVSQQMAQAAAMQEFIRRQTQMVWNATAAAQNSAATATYSAYAVNVTQTAQAQVMLDIHVWQTSQVLATQTAYALTATPMAAIQAGILRIQDQADRRDFWGQFVIIFFIFLSILVILLLILGGVSAYRRFMPVLELRLRTIRDDSPPALLSGTIVDVDLRRSRFNPWGRRLTDLPGQQRVIGVKVEVYDPSEPTVARWITEAEQKLAADGGI